ncbi:hypothetical protein JXB02_03260 [Candidatus Woesearchaeota archaeon]|nr:hypothetical protein [Candidatus Woesearchaeota archaeon]
MEHMGVFGFLKKKEKRSGPDDGMLPSLGLGGLPPPPPDIPIGSGIPPLPPASLEEPPAPPTLPDQDIPSLGPLPRMPAGQGLPGAHPADPLGEAEEYRGNGPSASALPLSGTGPVGGKRKQPPAPGPLPKPQFSFEDIAPLEEFRKDESPPLREPIEKARFTSPTPPPRPEEERPNIPRSDFFNLHRPLFVRVSEYKALLIYMTQMKDKTKDLSDIIFRLDAIKKDKDKGFEAWHDALEEVQRKLVYIDQSLFRER